MRKQSVEILQSTATAPSKSIFALWMERSGLSGKVLAGCAVVGVISLFLPAVTVSVGSISVSVKCIQGWQGKLGLLCYVALLVLGLLVYKKETPHNRTRLYAVIGAVAILMALLLLLDVTKLGNVGIGVILNLVAAAGTGAGALLKAKADQLF